MSTEPWKNLDDLVQSRGTPRTSQNSLQACYYFIMAGPLSDVLESLSQSRCQLEGLSFY